MKKVVTLICFVSLAVSTSCNREVSEISRERVEVNNLQKREYSKMLLAMRKLGNEMKNSGKLSAKVSKGEKVEYIDKETFDRILNESGLSELNISFEQFNELVEQNIRIREMGYKKAIVNSNYSTIAKKYLLNFLESGTYIKDLTSQEDFLKLSKMEQQVIFETNETILNYSNKGIASREGGGFWEGSAIGSAIGNLLCGPICGIAGWIIGGAVGELLN